MTPYHRVSPAADRGGIAELKRLSVFTACRMAESLSDCGIITYR